jgi:hypothetical protein
MCGRWRQILSVDGQNTKSGYVIDCGLTGVALAA